MKELGLLYRAERELGQATDIHKLGQCALRLVSELRKSAYVGLAIFEREQSHATAFLLDVKANAMTTTTVELGDGVLGRVVNRASILQLHGEQFSEYDIPRRIGGDFELQVIDALAMPLRLGEDIIGSVMMGNFDDPFHGTPPPPSYLNCSLPKSRVQLN